MQERNEKAFSPLPNIAERLLKLLSILGGFPLCYTMGRESKWFRYSRVGVVSCVAKNVFYFAWPLLTVVYIVRGYNLTLEYFL